MGYVELLRLAAPEAILLVTALGVLAADLFALRDLDLPMRRIICALIGIAGCGAAMAWLLVMPGDASVQQGIFIVDLFTKLVQAALLVLVILAILLSMEAGFSEHCGEYIATLLFVALGLLFLSSTEDLLMIFAALELTSLSLYVLTAFSKGSAASAEAALKYFLFGGMTAACTLFGFSLLYGISGSTNLAGIGAALKSGGMSPFAMMAIVMTLAGLGFKVAAAPFHLWAPDTYEAAPAPSAALIASGSKVAGFVVLAKVLVVGFAGVAGAAGWGRFIQGWAPVVAAIAIVSMVVGNFAAIVQTSVRRLLAYSAVAHSGYVLVGLLAHSGQSVAAMSYYVITYALTLIGAFGVVAIVREANGGDSLRDFAGLSKRSPLVAFSMLIFILSLAGIPPLPGFFGKFFVFTAALNGNAANYALLWLVLTALALSAVSLYYYLKVLKHIYVSPAEAQTERGPRQVLTEILVAVIAAAVLFLGCLPGVLLDPLLRAIQAAGL
ncbi:MAG TPA: NADH-quinone oxidoreductase subunit N [Verrucomicrobiae bacterium]|nr:NADH-quinone oxidoreductase subunit N [Verrucomicrobiae bacterium]